MAQSIIVALISFNLIALFLVLRYFKKYNSEGSRAFQSEINKLEKKGKILAEKRNKRIATGHLGSLY